MLLGLVESTFPHIVPDNRPVAGNHPDDFGDVVQYTIKTGKMDQLGDCLRNEWLRQ